MQTYLETKFWAANFERVALISREMLGDAIFRKWLW